MLNFFPQIYQDEILYSVLGRYHMLSGNNSFKDTIRDIFDKDTYIPTIEFPCNLSNLGNYLPYDAEDIIKGHTLLPIYFPFLPEKRRMKIVENMKNGTGIGIKASTGYLAGSLFKVSGLKYCPRCLEHDIKEYGEGYFHRIHQVQGVFVCHKHECFLEEYPIRLSEASRVSFLKFDSSKILNSKIKDIESEKLRIFIDIAKAVEYLLQNDLSRFNQIKLHKMYMDILEERGYLSYSRRVKQRLIYEEFSSFYNKEVLQMLNSEIDYYSEFNWLKVILRKPKRVVHPIRHILLIIFLKGNMENFFCIIRDKKLVKRKYPCLNPVCRNYRKLVISKCEVTVDYKVKEKIGTFYCECGFVYSRKIKDDIYKIGKIKRFGCVWEEALKKHILDGNRSIRGIGKYMRCDPKTIVKYADKFNLKHLLNTKMDIKWEEPSKNILNKVNEEENQNQRASFKAKIHVKKANNIQELSKISVWDKRDNEILLILEEEYAKLREENEMRRVTKSLLGKRINKLTTLEKNLDKLPRTNEYLNEILESIEDFQIRRIKKVCKDMIAEGEALVRWKIIRRAGLRTGFSEYVNDVIEVNINKSNY
ncbi:TnsD family Tn7-like transposition protein [Oceanirhabdus sp. W0125-5]|uniref:TnsD family Tn7-like transposition protein n=1 Tax=Oceanirhabdus sp. W0125-5 TaxID=2999116 RepID=UPI0022F2CB2D|nr:TnsD family Tn7-like transposition protein [Oceanirhabdus sp. W0125-5]WBW98091.1 TnsD family Tn7-like transposition protein [Oceanirhabdus sp. W0125-5]